MTARSRDAVLRDIEGIAPSIRAEAGPSERAGRATPALAEALADAGLFKLWLPPELGGDELPVPDAAAAFEAAAYEDGAAGWLVMIATGGNLFAAYLDDAPRAQIFGPREAMIAGSGTPSGAAHRTATGYLATGRWAYASGAHHATWFTANCLVHEGGAPVMVDGTPLIRAMAFPAERVEIIENWDTFGMRGTGSHDFAVSEAAVPASHTFSVFTNEPRLPGPLYRFPFVSISEVSFASVALGVGRRGLDEFQALAAEKSAPLGEGRLAGQPGVRERLAEAEATLASARSWFYGVCAGAWAAVEEGARLAPADESRVRTASIHAAAASARAVDLVFHVAGTSPVRMAAPLGRCWRDAHVVRQHALLSPLRLAQT